MSLTDDKRAPERPTRLRTVVIIVAVIGLIGYTAGAIAASAAGADDNTAAIWIIGAVPLALAVGLAVLFHRLATGRRVAGVDSPRSDTVLVWLFGATAALQAATLVVIERPWGRAMAGLACAASLAAATLFWFRRRRAR